MVSLFNPLSRFKIQSDFLMVWGAFWHMTWITCTCVTILNYIYSFRSNTCCPPGDVFFREGKLFQQDNAEQCSAAIPNAMKRVSG